MWTIEVYRSARELVSVWQDIHELYSIVAEICKKREDAPPEIELTTRFRECCGLVHEEEPLFFPNLSPTTLAGRLLARGLRGKKGARRIARKPHRRPPVNNVPWGHAILRVTFLQFAHSDGLFHNYVSLLKKKDAVFSWTDFARNCREQPVKS